MKLLNEILHKSKIEKKKRQIAILEKETIELKKTKVFTFDLIQDWMTNETVMLHPVIFQILKLAGFAPLSTAEVEGFIDESNFYVAT